MDPTLTRTQAHVLFGELYSKARPAELQERVDAAIADVSDIFVRIRRIQEIDDEYERSQSQGQPQEQRRPRRNGTAASSAATMSANPSRKPKKPTNNFLAFIFGKGDLATWGEKTGTIVTGLFGLNQHLSLQVQHAFTAFNEVQIVELVKAMRYFIQNGWSEFGASDYNSIVTAYQFFEEYLKVNLLFRKKEFVNLIVMKTIKMQVLYAQLIQFQGFSNFLQNDFVEYLDNQEDYGTVKPELKAAIDGVLGFEERRPRLSDCILAMYSITHKKLYTWNDLVSELKVGPPVVDRFRAPDKIQQVIHQRTEQLQSEIDFRKRSIDEISYIRENYFTIDERGKANVDFLQNVVVDILKRSSSDQRTSAEYLKATISEPHRLLAVLLKDLDVNFMQTLSGSVHVRGQTGSAEVILFRPGLFKAELDLLSELQRDLAEFQKKYKNASFSFSMFLASAKSSESDSISMGFRSIAVKSCQLFSSMQSKLRSTLVAHQEALLKEEQGKLKEALQRTKSIPIEAITGETRFLPWADAVLADSSRFDEQSVFQAVDGMVRCLFNYMYVFRDENLLQTLNSIQRLKSEMTLLERKLLHYSPERQVEAAS